MVSIEILDSWLIKVKWYLNIVKKTAKDLVDNFLMVWEVTQVETLESFVSNKFDLSKIRWYALKYLEGNKKPPIIEEWLIGKYIAHVKTRSWRRFKIQRFWVIPEIGSHIYFNKSLVEHQYR